MSEQASAERLRNKYTAVMWKRNHLNVDCWLKVEMATNRRWAANGLKERRGDFCFWSNCKKRSPVARREATGVNAAGYLFR
jgi:hypothetical protein